MMQVAVYGRLLSDTDKSYMQEFIDLLLERSVEIKIYTPFYKNLKGRIRFEKEPDTFDNYKDLKDKTDYMFSIGGDGTLLDTVRLVRDSKIPIIGINFGRLGFLASIGKEEVKTAIEAIEKKMYVLDKRSLLQLNSSKPIFDDVNYALNEFTLHKKDSSSMITIHTYINDEFLNTYWADGLIVATPTGSTAYSLSCGGPVIHPSSNNIVITPVAPHNLNVRPIVVPDDSHISFKVEGRDEHFFCTLDSHYETIDDTFELSVNKASHTINLVRLHENHFLPALRNKLMWGADLRN